MIAAMIWGLGMPARNVVVGQRMTEGKVQRARQFRRELTPAEQLLWSALRTNKLCGLHFRRQQIIDGFIVDFYCHAAGLVVEIDGPSHDERRVYHAERDRILAARDLRVLRFRNVEVLQALPNVLAQIAAACGHPPESARIRIERPQTSTTIE